MSVIANHLPGFLDSMSKGNIEVYNEFSLQHELGLWLRNQLTDSKVQFERNVGHFFPQGARFTKREIDISIVSKRKSNKRAVIELKFPRNGQHPEQMYSFVKDIAFCEELKTAGFKQAALVILVEDQLFHKGNKKSGIYGYFRAGATIHGRIKKPTGEKKESISIKGNYTIKWKPIMGTMKYALVEI